MSELKVEFPQGMEQLASRISEMVKELDQKRMLIEKNRTPDWVDVEENIAKHALEIEKAGSQILLQSLDIDTQTVRIGGVEYRRVGKTASPYYTMAGEVSVFHTLYREKGTHRGRVVDPVSLRAGVVGDGWLPRTARAMAYQLQQGTSREAERSGREQKRLPYSRASFERVGHLLGELYVKKHQEIEEILIEKAEIPAQAKSISVSIDRVSIAMEEKGKRPVGRPKKGAAKNPIERNYRMAYCGTVSLHDKEGEAISTIRYGRMPQGDAMELCQSLAGDVMVMLEKKPELNISLLADGALEIWNLFNEAFDEQFIGKEVHQVLDFWHAVEKLHAAAKVMETEESHKLKNRWKLMLLNGENAAGRILSELKNSKKEWVKVGDKQPVHEAITYLTNNLARMNYCRARKLGLPIGSEL